MRVSLLRLLVPALALFVVGCASGGGGPISLREQIGLATPGDLAQRTREVFERFQYELERADSSVTYQTYSTLWRGRYPFQDELDSGVVEVQTRLVVTGRARGGGSAGAANVRVVELRAENRVRIGEGTEWLLEVMTPMFRDYIDEIAEELKTRLTQGVRVY